MCCHGLSDVKRQVADGAEGHWYLSVYTIFPEVAKIHPSTAFTLSEHSVLWLI